MRLFNDLDEMSLDERFGLKKEDILTRYPLSDINVKNSQSLHYRLAAILYRLYDDIQTRCFYDKAEKQRPHVAAKYDFEKFKTWLKLPDFEVGTFAWPS